MIHPSYTDLMRVVNSDVEPGEEPLVNSRYSIVLATAKRARQIIRGSKPLVDPKVSKPLSIAVQEVYEGKVKILPDEATPEEARPIYEKYNNFGGIEELADLEGDAESEGAEDAEDVDDEDSEQEEKDEE
ncbi:MAG: DNA-directed RNA polymerase subunit omega [Lachnospiraceae bacterium]|nr:DNA-directed RNA polymerase subunit omega [Lachnospiraceae bacterium]